MKFTPLKFQNPLIKKMIDLPQFGCFAFPGSGKTAMTLAKVYHFKEPTLVICPLPILYTVWANEHTKWDQFSTLKLSFIHADTKFTDFKKRSGVYLINPEGILWLIDQIKSTKRFPFKHLVIDESIKFKNHKSKRWKGLKKVLKLFKTRTILCGNPIPNSYMDLWAQIYILDLGQRLGTSFDKFKNKYFWPTDYKRFNWELKPGAKEEIHRLIADITDFTTAKEAGMDLPKVMKDIIYYDLDTASRAKYDTMQKKLFSVMEDFHELANETEDNKLLTQSRAGALNKCRQIAQGFMYESYKVIENEKMKVKRLTHRLHSILPDLVQEQVEELIGEPVIIVYWFEEDYNNLKRILPNATYVDKTVTGPGMKTIEDNWNDNKISVLVAHVNKVSHGLNLQYGKGRHIFMYALTYNYDTFDQLIKRFERQGAEYDTVFIKLFICKDTIHEAMLESLNNHESETKGFFKLLEKYRTTRG